MPKGKTCDPEEILDTAYLKGVIDTMVDSSVICSQFKLQLKATLKKSVILFGGNSRLLNIKTSPLNYNQEQKLTKEDIIQLPRH